MAGFLSVRPQDWATPTTSAIHRMYAFGVGHGVYKSEDSGATWTTVLSPSFVLSGFAAFPGADTNTDTLVAVDIESPGGSATSHVHVSTDGGATWTDSTDRTGVSIFDGEAYVVLLSAVHWYIHYGELVSETTDGGMSYSDVSDPLGAGHDDGWSDRVFSVSASKIWGEAGGTQTDHDINIRSYDGSGLSTVDEILATAPAAFSDSGAIGFGRMTADPHLYLISGTGFSDITPSDADISVTWAANSPDGSVIVCMVHHTSTPNASLWRSADAGATWTEVSAENRIGNYYGYINLVNYAASNHTFWAVLGQGRDPDTFARLAGVVWISSDNGVTWTMQGELPGGDDAPSGLWVF